MPIPASAAARKPAPHDTQTSTMQETTASTTYATYSVASTTDQVDATTTRTLTRNGDSTDQGKNKEQSTNRAGITMVRAAAGSLVADANAVRSMAVHAVAGGRHAA